MSDNPKDVIIEVFPRILEELAFLFADPVEDFVRLGMPHDAIAVTIAFTGEKSGTLEMKIGRSLGIDMVSNLLGLDPDSHDAERAGDDALRELMNVTCGHILTSIAGDKPVFNLAVPQIEPLDASAWESLSRGENTAKFSVDGRPVQLCMTLSS